MKKEEAGAMGKAVKRREREAKIFIGSWGGGGGETAGEEAGKQTRTDHRTQRLQSETRRPLAPQQPTI